MLLDLGAALSLLDGFDAAYEDCTALLMIPVTVGLVFRTKRKRYCLPENTDIRITAVKPDGRFFVDPCENGRFGCRCRFGFFWDAGMTLVSYPVGPGSLFTPIRDIPPHFRKGTHYSVKSIKPDGTFSVSDCDFSKVQGYCKLCLSDAWFFNHDFEALAVATVTEEEAKSIRPMPSAEDLRKFFGL